MSDGVIVISLLAALAFGGAAFIFIRSRSPQLLMAIGGLCFTLAWMTHEGAFS